MPLLHLRFLGGFSAALDKEPPLVFPYDKVRALLAYLVMEAGEHRRDHLASLLWPDYPDEKARGNLRRCLFDLRRLLDQAAAAENAFPFLLVGKKTVAFNSAAACRLDVADFLAWAAPDAEPLRALEQRSAQYRGPFLAGLSLPDAPEFDTWLTAKREKLHRDALTLLEQLIREHEGRNDPERALAFAQQAIELDFWQEPLQRSYLRLLARQSQAAALTHFDVFRRALDEEIGVAPDGDTLQLVEDIRRGSGLPASASPRQERRRVVAMVCDIDIAGNDPEEIIERQAGPLSAATDIIRQRNGHVALAQGGEIIAYFGYPSAREHAPREAMDAALDMSARLAGEAALSFRIGLHSGWMLGSASPLLPDEAGIVSKTARRLALAAPDGRIAVSAELRMLVEPYCRFDNDGDERSSVVSGRNLISRRVDRYRERLSTLVGRHRELAALTALWSDVRQGHSRRILIRAEAGLGKSRLTHALVRHVGLSEGAVLELACQPEAAQTPYAPFSDHLVRLIGLRRGDARADCLDKAQAFLGGLRLHETPPAMLLDLLGFADDEARADETPLTQQDRKQADEKLLLLVCKALTRSQPALLIVEDLHWADHATLDFLPRLAAGTGNPLLLLGTSRPEQNPAVDAFFAAKIELPPLSTFAVEELAREVAGGALLGDARIASIIGRADGVPLYAEELTLSMLAGIGDDIPATLWDTLATRLDRVGSARFTAQQAAVIGRSFSLDLLQAIAAAGDDVPAAIRTLLRAGLIEEQRAGQYRFRHSLIRDVAYHSLALSERRSIHLRLANALRDSYADRLRQAPEILARHLSAAIDPAAAAVWLVAGSQAAARSANDEAIADFYAGLAALQPLPEDDAQRNATELQLQVALGTVLIAAEGYGSESAKSCFIRAWALSEKVADHVDLFPMMWGLWLGGRSCDNDVEPLAFAGKLERSAGDSKDPAIRMAVDYAYGNNYFWLGEIDRARRHLEAALARAPDVASKVLIARYGEDIAISSRAFLAWVRWMQGDLDGARQLAEDNVSEARRANHAHTLGYALCFLAVTYRHLRRPDLAAQASQELLAHAQQHDLLLWQAAAASILGWSMGITGNEAGLAPIEQGIAGARIAMRIVETTFMAFLADVLVHLNRDNALEVIAYALERAGNNHDVYYVPEFLRLQGEAILLKSPENLCEAAELFRKARQLAVSASSHTLALRCAVSQSRLLLREGKTPEACSLLEAARRQVSGSPDYPDLLEADALLTQIRQSLS